MSPISGRVGAFEWKVVAGAPPPREAVEIENDFAGEPTPIPPPERTPMLIERSEPAPSLIEVEVLPEPAIEAAVVEPINGLPAKADPAPAPKVEPVEVAAAGDHPSREPPAPANDGGPAPPRIILAPDDPGPTPQNEEADEEPRRLFRLF